MANHRRARILDQQYDMVPIAALKEHPQNPNKGANELIADSIDVNGFYGAVVVQRSTGYVLAGNHRMKQLAEGGSQVIPVIYLDVDDEHALRILLADNGTGRAGGYDQARLVELLRAASMSPTGLKGTGFTHGDLEQYSKDAADLSNMEHEQFLQAYRRIIQKACVHLKDNRFAVWVVADFRAPDGSFRNFLADTIAAFAEAGLQLYNHATYVTPIGSFAMRGGRQFTASRKLVKVHQDVLVFLKGDSKKAVAACGQVDTTMPGMDPQTTAAARVAPHLQAAAECTPVEQVVEYWVKRDDLFTVCGVYGGKARSCYQLMQGAPGVVTASSRQSPQAELVAAIARDMGIPAVVHTPTGAIEFQTADAEVVQHKAGYNTVLIKRAMDDATERGFVYVPFGMECEEAITQTAAQVANLVGVPMRRLVVPVGSGMSLAGILTGMQAFGLSVPVLAVQVGADPMKRLQQWAPPEMLAQVELVKSPMDYHDRAASDWNGISLDPVYEAKCVPFLQPGDLLWVVGRRLG